MALFMDSNTRRVLGLLAVVLAFGMGYKIGKLQDQPQIAPTPVVSHTDMGHTMPDGSIMGGQETSMSMSDMMADMSAALEGKSGDAFDKAFLAEMIVHHEGAVAMAELALKNAEHQELKDLAQDIIDAQEQEIAQMKVWQRTWSSN